LRKIDSILDEALISMQPDEHHKKNKTLLMWESIVGDELAGLVKPVGYEGSILLIRILHPAASMEIRLRKKEILEKLNSIWNEKLFTDLKKVKR